MSKHVGLGLCAMGLITMGVGFYLLGLPYVTPLFFLLAGQVSVHADLARNRK